MKRRGIYPWYSPTLRGIVVYFEVNWYWVDVVLNCTMRFKWVSQSSIATKLVDLLYPREAFWRVTDFKLRGTVKLFLPHPLHAMFVPLFELPAENNKHPNFVWRGGGGLCILLSSEMTLFEYKVSTILSPIVDSVSSSFLVLRTDPIAKWSISKRIQTTLDNTLTGFAQSSKVLEF